MRYFRSQLILINLGLLFLAAIVLVGAWWVNSDFVLEVTNRHHLQRINRMIIYELQKAFNNGWSDREIQDLVIDLSSLTNLEISLVTGRKEAGGEKWTSHSLASIHQEGLDQAFEGETYFHSLKSDELSHTMLWQLYSPVFINSKDTAALIISQKVSELERDLFRLRWPFTLFLILIGFGTIFISLLLMNKIIRPLQELETMARRVADGELACRVRDLGANELGRLGSAINEMAEKLAKSINRFRGEKTKLETILENMDDGLLVFDVNYHLELINKAAEHLLNLRRDQVLNRSIPELLVHPDLEDWVKEAFEKGQPVGGEFQTRIPIRRNIQVLIAPLRKVRISTGVIVLLRDLTQLRRLEQVRQDFVANVSHELRTPVTSIRALAETLMERETSPEEKDQFLQGILQESERMSYIVNDLLILAQLDAGKGFKDSYQPFVLDRLIRDTVEHLFSQGQREVRIALEARSPLIAAQEDRIRQVLINLLDNANKYSPPEEEIIISALRKGDKVEVRVADNGPGIPRLEQERIFERFYRVDKARSRAIGGTGLGLSIVRRIVEGYGGKVWVENNGNNSQAKGATFIFTLPIVDK